jgi:hypothetical protein
MTGQGISPARRLDQHIGPDHASLDMDGSDFREADGNLIDAKPAALAAHHGLVIYLDDGREKRIAFCQTTGLEALGWHDGFLPDWATLFNHNREPPLIFIFDTLGHWVPALSLLRLRSRFRLASMRDLKQLLDDPFFDLLETGADEARRSMRDPAEGVGCYLAILDRDEQGQPWRFIDMGGANRHLPIW